jgi:hypothetical protein
MRILLGAPLALSLVSPDNWGMRITLHDDPLQLAPTLLVPYGPIELSEDRNPWERQPSEPPLAWTAFTFYRDSARRTLTGVAAAMEQAGITPPSHHTLMRWRKQYRWDERAEAYDRAVDEDTAAVLQRRRRDLKREAADIGATLLQLAAARLAELLRTSSMLKPRDLIDALRLSMELQRYATDTEPQPALISVTNLQVADDELLARAAEALGPHLLTVVAPGISVGADANTGALYTTISGSFEDVVDAPNDRDALRAQDEDDDTEDDE